MRPKEVVLTSLDVSLPGVRTDGRVEVCAKSVPTVAEPRTFVQWVLKEQNSHQTDVRPVAPTTIGWPIWPAIDRARPCECRGAITNVTAAAVGVC